MTVVIAGEVRGKWAMAADGRGLRGDRIMTESARKVRSLPSLLIGASGDLAVVTRLVDAVEPEDAPEDVAARLRKATAEVGEEDAGASALVVYRGSLYVVEPSGVAWRSQDDVAAIGSGATAALGAFRAATRILSTLAPLPAEEVLLLCVESACAVHPELGGRISSEPLEPR